MISILVTKTTAIHLQLPNGTAQMPQDYWCNVGIKNLLDSCTAQYRIYPNGSVSGAAGR